MSVQAGQDAGARADWQERIGRADGKSAVDAPRLPAPGRLRATPGRGLVALDWDAVPGAVGYEVHVAAGAGGPFTRLDHGGGDVLAVPRGPYADTTAGVTEGRWYAVAALSDVRVAGPLSAPVHARATTDGSGEVCLEVAADASADLLPRPWEPMIGSEHLSHLLSTDTSGGRAVGAELLAALRHARDDFGVRSVRAHGILCDDLGVYREVDGRPVHDFTGVDRVYDLLLGEGLRPVVELSFMPHDLARDPSATVFAYGAHISPPRDWTRWGDLVHALVEHLVDRYGLDEVVDRWSFEVWNEANLEVFWAGTPEEFWRLYDVTARAVKAVDDRLVVGGPASAAAGWVEEQLHEATRTGAPLDFVSTHTYGVAPLDLRAQLERHGRGGTPLWWTEWGATPTHFAPVNDSVQAGAFLLHGMRSALGTIEALSYWVVSDHFEELGRPPELLHGGFGLRTVGDLPKPRFHALAMLGALGPDRLPVSSSGDGAGSLVESVAARGHDGTVQVLLWCHTLDQTGSSGSDALARRVTVTVGGLRGGSARVVERRVAPGVADVAGDWAAGPPRADWPASEQDWAALAKGAELGRTEHGTIPVTSGRVQIALDLPCPSFLLLELSGAVSVDARD